MKLKDLLKKLNASGVMDKVYTDEAIDKDIDELRITGESTVSEFWMEGDNQHTSQENVITTFCLSARDLRLLAQNCLEVANELEGYQADGSMPD